MSQSYGGYQKIGTDSNGHENVATASAASAGGVSPIDVKITEEELMSNNGGGGSSIYSSSFFRDNPRGDMYNWRKIFKFLLGAMVAFMFLRMISEHNGDEKNQKRYPTPTSNVVQQQAEKKPSTSSSDGGNNLGDVVGADSYDSDMASRNEKNQIEAIKVAQSEEMAAGTSDNELSECCESTIMLIRHCEKFSDDVVQEQYLHKHCSYVGFERAMYLSHLFGPMGPSESDAQDKRGLEEKDKSKAHGNGHTTNHNNQRTRDPNEALTRYEILEDIAISEDVTKAMLKEAFEKQAKKPKYPYPAYLFAFNPVKHAGDKIHDYSGVETLGPLSNKYNVEINQDYASRDYKELSKELVKLLNSGKVCGKTVLVAWAADHLPELAAEIGCGPTNGCPEFYQDDKDYDALWQIKFVFDPPLNPKYLQGSDAERLNTAHALNDSKRKKGWEIWGSIRHQGFDPLQFSTAFLDYDTANGTKVGGRWMIDMNELDE